MSFHKKFHETFTSCPNCGKRLNHEKNSVSCETCKKVWYNNPAPATSIALIKDGKILLAKRKIEPHKGEWDILGGFIEAGESAEETVIREMKEETTLDVEVDEYLGSVWDIYEGRPTLPMLYLVKMKNKNQIPTPQDDVEELKWFTKSEIPKNLAFRNVEIILQKEQKYLKK